MKRTKSSLLAFKLREFLNTKDIPFEPSLHSVPELSAPAPSYPRTPVAPRSSSRSAAPPPGEDAIWVDCFYYGFYMDKKKLPAFQASLRQNQALQSFQQKPMAATAR